MTVHWTAFHFVLATVSALPLALFGDEAVARLSAAALAAASATSLILNLAYARLLGGRPRSVRRKDADRRTALVVLGWLPVSLLAVGLLVLWHPYESYLRWGSIEATCLLIVELGFIAVFLSSLIDRYLVTPWRDGVIGPPPFERGQASRSAYTKMWVNHRLAATALFFVAFWVLCGLAWFKAFEASVTNSWLVFLLSLVSPAVIPVVVMRGWIRHLADAVSIGFGHVDLRVGDYIECTNATDMDAGIVYEVSTDRGYIVLADDGHLWTLPLSDARPSKRLRVDHAPPTTFDVVAAITSPAATNLGDARDYLTPKTEHSNRWVNF
ncbi:hypothetical protein HNR19_000294 [Nocardioides thalensis]|uniref:Uncharacterized protein n=1 Tax=Nocardioides thalensis TaxID=1914755 RepID=A0A853BXV4_9ACTN|nr:hypothetical protein [Nocardioides thalensis]NYI99595.1 hypothetical protein [Nocardioides thalensis]